MGTLSDFQENAEKHVQASIDRLNDEIKFADSIRGVQPKLRENIIQKFANDGFIGTGLAGVNQRLEDLGIVGDIGSATNIAEFTENLSTVAVDALIDPTINTGLSAILNTAAGDFVKSLLPADALGFLQDFSVSNILSTVVGDNNLVSQLTKDGADIGQKQFIKVLNTLSLSMITTPQSIFGTFDRSISNISITADVSIGKLDRVILLQAEIVSLLVSLTTEFYNLDLTEIVEDAKPFLERADETLTSVRSRMISFGIFEEGEFRNARSNVENAQQALSFDLTTDPRVREINSKLDEMDQLLDEIEKEENTVVEINENLEGAVPNIIERRILGMLFGSQVHYIQLEIRSIIRSMEEIIRIDRNVLTVSILPIWRSQLVLLSNTMAALHEEITQYISNDPDGFVADFDVTVSALSALGPSGIEVLISQGKAFVRATRSALANEALLAAIPALASAVDLAASGVRTFFSDAKGIADSHVSPGSEVREFAEDFVSLLDESGYDRASEFLEKGDLIGLLEMSAQSATFSGATLENVNDIIECLETSPKGTVTLTGLNKAKEVQDFFFNAQRAEFLLSATFGLFRDQAKKQIREVELPELRRTKLIVDQLAEILQESGCEEIL